MFHSKLCIWLNLKSTVFVRCQMLSSQPVLDMQILLKIYSCLKVCLYILWKYFLLISMIVVLLYLTIIKVWITRAAFCIFTMLFYIQMFLFFQLWNMEQVCEDNLTQHYHISRWIDINDIIPFYYTAFVHEKHCIVSFKQAKHYLTSE